MEISTTFLTDYLIERDLNWELFEGLSPMAAVKKEQLIANWRFGDTIDSEDVKKIFKTFKRLNMDTPVEGLSYDEFIKAYLNQSSK